ncbi:hypothetical protein GCM10010343_12600 [Streptomyces avidinii]|nr:hypothetical protein GCM10010343_12600 [Streptomyces avidinii]
MTSASAQPSGTASTSFKGVAGGGQLGEVLVGFARADRANHERTQPDPNTRHPTCPFRGVFVDHVDSGQRHPLALTGLRFTTVWVTPFTGETITRPAIWPSAQPGRTTTAERPVLASRKGSATGADPCQLRRQLAERKRNDASSGGTAVCRG